MKLVAKDIDTLSILVRLEAAVELDCLYIETYLICCTEMHFNPYCSVKFIENLATNVHQC